MAEDGHLAIAADVACLFASAAWFALNAVSLPAGAAQPALAAASSITTAWCWLGAGGVALGTLLGLGATIFSIADDHLKARSAASAYRVPSVPFNLYLLRLSAWLLSLLPCAVIDLGIGIDEPGPLAARRGPTRHGRFSCLKRQVRRVSDVRRTSGRVGFDTWLTLLQHVRLPPATSFRQRDSAVEVSMPTRSHVRLRAARRSTCRGRQMP